MNQKDYERLKRQIEEQYQKDIASLDRIMELSRNGSEAPAQVESTIRPEEVEEAVIAILPAVEGIFNKRRLATLMREADPTLPADIHFLLGGILKQLEGTKVELVEKGKGKRPSDYRRIIPGLSLDEVNDDVLPKNE
jgi:hypothetical protein